MKMFCILSLMFFPDYGQFSFNLVVSVPSNSQIHFIFYPIFLINMKKKPLLNFSSFLSKHNNSPLSNDRGRQSKPAHVPPLALRHLWIRTALMEKLLDKIVVYLVEHSRWDPEELGYRRAGTRRYPTVGFIVLSLCPLCVWFNFKFRL